MLATDVEIVDIDGRHWDHWIRLLAPPAVIEDPRWAAVFVERGRPVKTVVAGRGAVPQEQVPFTGTSRDELAALAAALGVRAVCVLDVGALPAVVRDVEASLSLDQDFVAQGVAALRALKKHNGKGVWVEPHILDLVPTPPAEALQRSFDVLIPDGSAMVAYVIEDDRSDVHASIIAVKQGGHVDLATTHLGLADVIDGPRFARDWRGHRRALLAAVEERYAKPCVALFLEKSTFYRVLTGPSDQLARELNAKNVVIDPAPAWLLGLLGGATVAAFAGRGARALAGVLPPAARRMASDFVASAQSAMRTTGAHPFSLLGFDPVELWLSLRDFYRRP